MIWSALVTSLLAFAVSASAAIPPMKVVPLGKADAPVKGTFYNNVGAEPEDFNPMSSQELAARNVYTYCVEGLLSLNPETYKFEPGLADSYEISKDALTYKFHINPKAHFSDGHPVTSEDVKFTIEAIRDPRYKATYKMPYYEDIASIDTPDPQTVIFHMKKKYYLNLENLGTTSILPKHIYGDPNKKFPIAPIYGSGPYKVEAYNRGKNIVLVRDANWWAKDEKANKGLAKFDRINFRFIKEENLTIEMVKKGEIDYMFPIQPENFEKKAVGEPFGTTIRKVEAENKISKSWGFIGWNMKNPMFQDRDVRIALSKLLNRKMLIDKFRYGKDVEARGPVYYKSPFMPKDVKAIEFDPAGAKKLLKKAGWADHDHNGILEKTIDGQKKEFRFSLLLPNRDVEKYFTIYKEDLRKAGIDMEIKLIEWNTFTKLLDEQKFEAVTLSWGGAGQEEDLKQIWHSDSAKEGGSNFISYKNPEVDKYIDQARQEMNANKRKVLWQKAVRLIAHDAPYTFLFNAKYTQFLVNSRIGYDKPTYTYDFSTPYWYIAK